VRRSRFALASLTAAVVAACGPQLDSNGSNPGALGALADLYANDPALGYDVDTDSIVLAYDDEAGAFDADTTNDTLVPRQRPSRAGISVSRDHGATWSRVGPILPATPSCGDPVCAVALGGSATLAPLSYSGNVLYVGLASTDPSLAVPDALAYATSDDGGGHWTVPRVTGRIPGRPPGEPSMDRAGSTALVVYADRPQGELQILTGNADPFEFPNPPAAVPIDRDDVGVPKVHPIVRSVDGTHAYVAYLLPRDEQGTTFDLRVALLYHPLALLQFVPWQGLVVFRLDNVAIDATRPGGLGRAWRDDAPVSFAVAYGPRLYLAFRERSSSTGRSRVYLAQCDASLGSNCAIQADGTNSAGWATFAVDDLVASTPFPAAGQYRPVVAADRFGSAVAVSWMQEVQPGSTEVTLAGAVSTADAGLELGPAMDLREGNGGAWTPCPTAGLVGAALHSYGDHDAVVVLPFDPKTASTATVVGAHVDSSGGCQDLGALTFDQHVAVSTW
jgi:hypothetical protein